MRRRIKIVLWFLTIAFGFTALLFVPFKPETIFYASYNGLAQYSRMYYVDNESISIDTTTHSSMRRDAMQVQKEKKTETSKFKIAIPLILLFDSRERVGSPDVIDQGGVVVDFMLFGIHKRFDIDPMMDQNVEMKYYTEILSDIDNKMLEIEQEINK